MNAFEQYEVWFVTGAQLLYGGDAVIAVDAHSNEMVKGLNDSGKLPVKVVYKGTIYLYAYSILRSSPKPLYLKVLFNPFEKQLHTPSISV